jgi:hypothetical protein
MDLLPSLKYKILAKLRSFEKFNTLKNLAAKI